MNSLSRHALRIRTQFYSYSRLVIPSLFILSPINDLCHLPLFLMILSFYSWRCLSGQFCLFITCQTYECYFSSKKVFFLFLNRFLFLNCYLNRPPFHLNCCLNPIVLYPNCCLNPNYHSPPLSPNCCLNPIVLYPNCCQNPNDPSLNCALCATQ